MGIRDQDLDAGLIRAFQTCRDESALQAIQRLHGAGSSLLLRDVPEETTPVLLRRDGAEDDPRYRILGEIAHGGVGVVYKAHDQDLNRDVALKLLRREFATRVDVVQRFVEEAQVGGQLQHPGIVPIYGLGLQRDGRPWFVMKLIKGKTLAALLDHDANAIDLLAVFEQVAQTIAYAHSRGVIHRDLKPSNVMVGAFGEVQVVDWGFAKILGHDEVRPDPSGTIVTTVRSGGEGSQSVAGSVMGTPAYMPPEQAMGRIDELDERSDVFALGAILCEILTGKPPYTGEQKDQLIAATQCRLEPAFERLANAGAPVDLVRIARDCLQPLAGDRPGDAGALAERLHQHFASVEERARKAELDAVTSEASAAQERFLRRRALVLAAAAMVAMLAGGGGYLRWRGDHAARLADASPRIASALRAASQREGEQDWAAAAAAAREAVDVAASAGVGDAGAAALLVRLEQSQRVADEAAARRAADEALLAALEEARALMGDHYTDAQIDAAYAAAVRRRWPDLRVDTEALAGSAHGKAIAAAFDSWAHFRRAAKQLPDADWRPIDGWARAIDPEADALRDMLARQDFDGLETFAAELDVDALPPNRIDHVAKALLVAKRNDTAIALLRRAHLRHPGEFWIHFHLGLAAMKAEDLALAVCHLQAAVALRPRSVEARHRLGVAQEQQGDVDSALATWRDALALRPDWLHGRMHVSAVLVNRGDLDGAGAEAVAVLAHPAVDAANAAEAHDRVGWIHFVRQELAPAEQAFRRAIELAPAQPQYHSKLGHLYLQRQDPRQARLAFREAVRLAPDEWESWGNLAAASRAAGDSEGALLAWQRARALNPRIKSLVGIELCDHLCRYGEAIAEFERVLAGEELDGNAQGFVHSNIGVAWRKQRRFEQAIASGRRAIELAPGEHNLHYSLAVTFEEAGRFADALDGYRTVLDLQPLADKAPERAARMERFVAWEMQLPELLQADAVALPPDELAQLGYLLLCRQRFAESARCYQQAFSVSPELASPRGPHACCAVRSAVRAGTAWQTQALAWMRPLLAAQEARWQQEPAGTMVDLLTMRHDPDLACVRDADDLPDEWRQYWSEHATLITRLQAEAAR